MFIFLKFNIVINSRKSDSLQKPQAKQIERQVDSDKGLDWTRIRAYLTLVLQLLSFFIGNAT